MHVLLGIGTPAILAVSLRSAAAQRMYALATGPLRPGCRPTGQGLPGKNAVARRVLHVDVDVLAPHGDDEIHVDLQVVRDALLHAERVRRGADIPATQL